MAEIFLAAFPVLHCGSASTFCKALWTLAEVTVLPLGPSQPGLRLRIYPCMALASTSVTDDYVLKVPFLNT